MNATRSGIIAASLASLLTGVFVFAFAIPGNRRMRDARRELHALQADVQCHQAVTAGLTDLWREVRDLADQTADFDRAIPAAHQFTETHRRLSQDAVACQLRRRSIQPGRVVPLAALQHESLGRLPRGVMVQPVVVELEGSLSSLMEFFVRLGGWERTHSVERAVLRRVSSERSEVTRTTARRPPTIACELLIHTYFMPRTGGDLLARRD